MFFDSNKKCPYFRKKCLKHDCTHYIALRGLDPQTGQEIDQYGCAIVWQVIATLEGNKETRQAAKAVESLRNKLVLGLRDVLTGISALVKQTRNPNVIDMGTISPGGQIPIEPTTHLPTEQMHPDEEKRTDATT